MTDIGCLYITHTFFAVVNSVIVQPSSQGKQTVKYYQDLESTSVK
jgi:hypothetical protein